MRLIIATILLLVPATSFAAFSQHFTWSYLTESPTPYLHIDGASTGNFVVNPDNTITLNASSTGSSHEISVEWDFNGLPSVAPGESVWVDFEATQESTGGCRYNIANSNTHRTDGAGFVFPAAGASVPRDTYEFVIFNTFSPTNAGFVVERGSGTLCDTSITIHSIYSSTTVYFSATEPDSLDPTTLNLPTFITEQFSSGGGTTIEVPDYTSHFDFALILIAVFLFLYGVVLFRGLASKYL